MSFRPIALLFVAITLAAAPMLTPKPAKAALATPYLVAMLSGPISDGASVILLKKHKDFISWKTPAIACVVGAGAGTLAATLPSFYISAMTGFWVPIRAWDIVNFFSYGCAVSGFGGLGGALTELGLVSLFPPH